MYNITEDGSTHALPHVPPLLWTGVSRRLASRCTVGAVRSLTNIANGLLLFALIFPALLLQVCQQRLILEDQASIIADSTEINHELAIKIRDKVCHAFVFVGTALFWCLRARILRQTVSCIRMEGSS